MFRSVLLADSSVESRDRLYEMLFSLGYKVECAPNANEALVRLQTERPYLLVLDENLVSAGWLKTMEEIRKFDRKMKVVLLTKDEPDAGIEAKARSLGVTTVVKKNFSTHIMLKGILEILSETEESLPEDRYADLGEVLIVDDTPEMRMTMTTYLQMRGFKVKDAANGDQALMEIKMRRPKLVLLDQRMTGMDGLVALKKIKELDSAIKVVMLTGVEDEDIINEAKRLGACDYLTKPCDLEKIEALILSILIPEKYARGDTQKRG